MPDPNDFEPRLADAFRRYSNQAPTNVDAVALAREIASGKTTESRQHPRWWPFGRTNQKPGRSRNMIIASGVTAVVAIATLAASYALIGQPIDEVETRPAATSPELVGDDWTFFEGTLAFDGNTFDDADQRETEAVNGLIVETALGWEGQTLSTSDPRMTGSRTEVGNSFEKITGGGDVPQGYVSASINTIETDLGSWSCRMQGAVVGDLGAESGWCDGSGGLEGLRAFILIDVHNTGAFNIVPIVGYITAGDGPPFPEAPAE